MMGPFRPGFLLSDSTNVTDHFANVGMKRKHALIAILCGGLLIAGVLLILAVRFFDEVVKIDDPVGAISVHGVNGVWGTVAVGIFSSEYSVLCQLTGALATFAFIGVGAFVICKIVDAVIGLRVSENDEIIGLDISEHAMESYADFNISMVQ